MKRAARFLAAILLAAVAWESSRLHVRETAKAAADRPLLYLPSGKYLRVISFGYDSLLADAIYLWAIQYYGQYEGEFRHRYLNHVFDVITDLDPRYVDAYWLGSLILNLEAGRPADAVRLLDKGIANNPEDWQLPLEAGFIVWQDLADFGRAAEYFAKADRPGAPLVVPRLRAAMLQEVDPGSAFELWKSLHETSPDPVTRSRAVLRMRDLRIQAEVDVLERAVAEFRRRFGFAPGSFGALIRAGILRDTPIDPDGNPYILDPRTGTVRSLRGLRFGRLRAGGVPGAPRVRPTGPAPPPAAPPAAAAP